MTRGYSLRTAQLIHWLFEEGLRVAVVACPFCSAEHRHCVPVDILASVPLIRAAPCDARRGDYQIQLAIDKSSVV